MTIDLTDNKVPFGLLSEEEQDHLSSWPHGLLVLRSRTGGHPIWCRVGPKPKLSTTNVYRTIPAPVMAERETVWIASNYPYDWLYDASLTGIRSYVEGYGGFAFRIEFDAETGDNPTITKETFDER